MTSSDLAKFTLTWSVVQPLLQLSFLSVEVDIGCYHVSTLRSVLLNSYFR